ncbi:single-stranded DNA-binding protein [Paenarthrobacter sp. R1]|uniref:single-stranded DNA-binding protein n=1 Tax=Paenarthrobacter sp. R1 TaxID=3049085 RepID=UPI002555B700|nr:single-stranded DNA-binding protein [Paenarthrobacter sp. R1]WIV32191.1 single-stranded DNA-binding protein [Paenarthrobacter sp. R1]
MSIPTITDIAGIINAPELRYTQSGKAVLSMRLAFNDSKYDEQQRKWVTTKTFYADAQAWEHAAERLAETLSQGEQVYVVGRLETQQWEKDGEKKSKPVLNLQTVRKLAKAEPQQAQQPRSQQAPQDDPWATPAASAGGWGNGPTADPAF